MTAKRSILESTGRWTLSSAEAIGTKNSIPTKAARIHGSGRLVWGKASRTSADPAVVEDATRCSEAIDRGERALLTPAGAAAGGLTAHLPG